jgi:hypothetical protein
MKHLELNLNTISGTFKFKFNNKTGNLESDFPPNMYTTTTTTTPPVHTDSFSTKPSHNVPGRISSF